MEQVPRRCRLIVMQEPLGLMSFSPGENSGSPCERTVVDLKQCSRFRAFSRLSSTILSNTRNRLSTMLGAGEWASISGVAE